MSIPITCAGCKSAFDVPDNLAGKTIRCTSCKAQMTVPDEAVDVVEAVDEAPAPKKPAFGSGVKSTVSAAAPKPAPKPAPAPAAKAAPAKVTAKPVAKADEDDEDDDGKSDKDAKPQAKPTAKPAAGTKKPGITGSTKKRRSDDEDDDEDDAPRKKKKAAGGGSGPMVAIIAGATIGLALIAGLGIYLLTGSKDKGTETAGGTNTTSTTGTNNAITPPSGMPGVGRPIGETPGPAGPGTGMGTPGVGTPGMGASGMGTPGMGTPGMSTPAKGAGGPGGGNPFSGLGKLDRLGTPGAWAAFNGDGFTAEFPGAPETKTEGGAQGMTLKVAGVGSSDAAVALVMSFDLPQVVLQASGNDPRAMLNTFMAQAAQSGELKNKVMIDTTVDGCPAKEFSLNDSEGEGKMRVAAAKNRIFMFIAGGPYKNGKPSMSRTDVDRFFNSIKITYKGDLVAGGPGAVPMMPDMGTPPGIGARPMIGGPGPAPVVGEGLGGTLPGVGQPPLGPPGVGQPPMGGPGVGQPPFGQPGGVGNPAGATGDGNRKAKIESFYAAAFDTENQELYTIDARPTDPRTRKGWLRRYSADFKVLGRYHLPQMASRAVIDPKAGLLYAATVTNPTSAEALNHLHLLDNASGSGDIVIYDLKQVRNGKTADGKELKDGTELKPVATVTIKHLIHALELSDDGKSLYVLTTSTVGTKKTSSLLTVDTETRKSTSTPLPKPARDMAKSGDGKGLIVIEEFSASAKGASVGTFDFASASLINVVSFPGAVVDVAPIKSGGAVVTVLPTDNQPAAGGFGPPGGAGGPMGGIGGPPGGFGPPGGIGGPPGGIGGGDQPAAHKFKFRLYLLNDKGNLEMEIGTAQRFSNAGYAEFDPENKKLFVSSYRETGLDVFDVTDAADAKGLKLTATIHTAGREKLGGHCVVTPDGKALVFHTGLVIDTANVGGGTPGAAGAAPGFPGGNPVPPGGIVPPGGVLPPGGMGPGVVVPPAGVMPPGGFVPPGGMGPGVVVPPGGMMPQPGGMPPGGMGAPGVVVPPPGVMPPGEMPPGKGRTKPPVQPAPPG